MLPAADCATLYRSFSAGNGIRFDKIIAISGIECAIRFYLDQVAVIFKNEYASEGELSHIEANFPAILPYLAIKKKIYVIGRANSAEYANAFVFFLMKKGYTAINITPVLFDFLL